MHARSPSGPWPGTTTCGAEGEHPVARVDPLLHRAGPHDRVAAVEHEVAGEEDPGVGQVHGDVAAGVGRARARGGGRRGRRRGRSSAPSKVVVGGATSMPVEGEARRRSAAGRRRRRPRSGAAASSAASVDGRHLVHLPCAGRRGDDLGAGDELVAVAVVAVGVGVHERADPSGRRGHGPQVVEHPGGEREVEQRVDEQRRVAVGDEPGVRPAPAAVGLQVGPDAVADLVGAALVGHRSAQVEAEVEAAARRRRRCSARCRAA